MYRLRAQSVGTQINLSILGGIAKKGLLWFSFFFWFGKVVGGCGSLLKSKDEVHVYDY